MPETTSAPRRTISPSQITTYLMCGRLYRYRYVDKFPAEFRSSGLAFGSAVHAAIEAWQMSRLVGEEITRDEVLAHFTTEWEAEKAGDVKFKAEEDESVLVERGSQLIALFMDTMKDEPPAAVELGFEVPLGVTSTSRTTGEITDVALRGVFDLVLDDDRVVEMKTAAKAWSEQDAHRHLQLTAYSFAYEQLRGRVPTLEIVALVKTKQPKIQRIATTRTAADHDWFRGLVQEVVNAIAANAFPPNPGWMCGGCEYAGRCGPIGIGGGAVAEAR